MIASFEALTSGQRVLVIADFLQRHPLHLKGWIALAAEAEDMDCPHLSKRYLERSIEIAPPEGKVEIAYFNLALLLENRLDDYINARLNYLNAIHVNPSYDRSYNNLGLLLQNQFSEPHLAEHYFKEGLHRFPNDANMHHNLAVLYAQHIGDYLRAKQHLEMALELDPHNKDIEYDLRVGLSDIFGNDSTGR